MHLTPDILEYTYEYLRRLPPFNKWKLPQGDTISFYVTKHTETAGICECWENGLVRIKLSAGSISHTDNLIRIMAHEMVHLHIDRGKKERAHHGPIFKRYAARVCQLHGFDPKMF